jgi:hypothetical protein
LTDSQLFIETLVLIALIFFVFWRRNIFLYLILFPVMIGAGLHWYDVYSSPMGFLIAGFLVGTGVYSFVLGLWNALKGKEE